MPSDSSEILRRWYSGPYSEITASANGSAVERYMHGAMERPYGETWHFPRVLELGGNRGEHLAYVRHGFDQYVLTDLVVPEVDPLLVSSRNVTMHACDAGSIPFADGMFDRVVMTCVLHHVDSPLQVATEMRRVVRPGGIVTLLLPCDPGTAYRWGKAATSGRLARKRGLREESRLVDAIAHHNHFRSIRVQVEEAFRGDDIRIDWLPFRIPSMNLNAFTVWQITRGHSPGRPVRRDAP